ncbi:MAG TPA: hypothetical protein DGP89_02155 [Saprospirales bacterium]|nr:hypothetical protein [Saprospirales bacterium]
MKYKKAIEYLDKAFSELPEGVELTKGGIGELALANHLGHTLVDGDKNADAYLGELEYEYKISHTDQFNFNFGTRQMQNGMEWQEKITTKVSKWEGAYCARVIGVTVEEVAYIDSTTLLDYLLEHFSKTKGQLLVKNFSMKAFKALKNSS